MLGLIDTAPTEPELTIGPTASHRGAGLLHRSGDLIAPDIRSIDGVRTTNAVRTLIDLGAVVRPHVLTNAVETAFRERLITHDRLVRRFFELARRGRPGIGPMRRLLVARDPSLKPAGSNLETLLLRILARHGLPEPVRQHEVVIKGHRFFIDVAFPEALLAIEADGFGIHTAHDAFVRDRVRQNLLVMHGWLVLRYAWRILCDQPGQVAAEVASALRLRSRSRNE